jgi:diphosphomevalonate decarboxylase
VTDRVTVSSPANIAFLKYWGTRDPREVLPYHPSISMTLETCRSVTTAQALPAEALPEGDQIYLAGDPESEEAGALTPAQGDFRAKARAHLDIVRQATGRAERFRIATRNSFPSAAGMASSASGFSALALAATRALGLELSTDELSILARRSGSGSAARSIVGGFVEWPADPGDPASPARQIADASWQLADVVAVLETGPKEVSSREGHRRAPTSPYFDRRLELVPTRLETIRRAIAARDLDLLGPVLEAEAIDLHSIAMTSEPPIFYWSPGSVEVLGTVRALRQDGISAWSTMDAGANVHVICPREVEGEVARRLGNIPAVQRVIRDHVGHGPRVEDGLDLFG